LVACFDPEVIVLGNSLGGVAMCANARSAEASKDVQKEDVAGAL